MKVFAKFKERYPNHPLPYSHERVWWYERMLGREEKKLEYLPEPTKQALKEYEEWAQSRRFTSFALSPPDVKEKLLPVINELLSLGIQNADLIGSFSRGDYCLNEQDLAIKNRVRHAKISDVDVVIHDKEYRQPKTCDVLNNTFVYPAAIPIIRDGKFV